MKLLLSFLCLSFAIASAGDSQKLGPVLFHIGLRIGLTGNKKFYKKFRPKRLAAQDGLRAGQALRALKLSNGAPGEVQFNTPPNFAYWITSYQRAVAIKDEIEQKMLLAAIGGHVSIKTKADYVKPK